MTVLAYEQKGIRDSNPRSITRSVTTLVQTTNATRLSLLRSGWFTVVPLSILARPADVTRVWHIHYRPQRKIKRDTRTRWCFPTRSFFFFAHFHAKVSAPCHQMNRISMDCLPPNIRPYLCADTTIETTVPYARSGDVERLTLTEGRDRCHRQPQAVQGELSPADDRRESYPQ